MSEPKEKEEPEFVECATGLTNDDDDEPDEIEMAKSMFDEIVDETESEEDSMPQGRHQV